MNHEQPQFRQSRLAAARFLCPAGALLVLLLPVAAQDIRGMERCTAETRMERRTGCLQANVEYLQQVLIKLTRETQDKLAATDRDLAAARAEIASLKSALEKLNSELTQMKTSAESSGKK
jgi:septal ring factor EnvC (AmiA/AmiB activator)